MNGNSRADTLLFMETKEKFSSRNTPSRAFAILPETFELTEGDEILKVSNQKLSQK